MNQQQLITTLYEALAGFKRVMMRSRDQLLGELQLTRTQIEVLMLLGETDNQTIGDLAGRLAVTHSASTQTVETLVKRDLVERTADTSDRRVVRTKLSATGKKLVAKLHKSRMQRMTEVFTGLTDDELKMMILVLERLTRQFDETNLLTEVKHGN